MDIIHIRPLTGPNRVFKVRRILASVLVFLAVAWLSQPLSAAEEQRTFASTEQEQLYNDLIEELRCLVCQNQNIADSNAELAQDLRNRTYDMVTAGQSEAEIKQFMRDRFGDFVLYSPPLDRKTWLLWLGPVFILLAALAFAVALILRNARQPTTENEDSGTQL